MGWDITTNIIFRSHYPFEIQKRNTKISLIPNKVLQYVLADHPLIQERFREPRQTDTSPSLSKIAQLNDKVKSIQPAYEETRSAKREIFQNKIGYIDDRLNKTELQNDQKFKLLAEQLNKIQDGANQETFAKEVQAEKRLKEIKLLDKDFSLNISKEHQEKKENETKMLRQIDEKIQEMKVELFRDRKKREDYEVFRASEIENKINDLYESFEIEKRTRDQVSDNLIKTFGEEVIKFQELLCQEKKAREEQHNGLLGVLQELNDSLTSEVEQEKSVRENSEGMLLKLLEDTCAKIENTLLRDDE